MSGQLLREQANARDSATSDGFAELVTGTLPPPLSHQLIPHLGQAIKGRYCGACGGLPALPLLGEWGCQTSGCSARAESRLGARETKV